MKKQVKDWLFLANDDLSAAEIIIKEQQPLTNIVSFHCQQAIEKYIKAFLIENEIPLVKTHDLIKLNNMISEVKKLYIDEKKLIVLNEVYIDSRYPGELGLVSNGMPSVEQAKIFIGYAKEIKEIINNELSSIT